MAAAVASFLVSVTFILGKNREGTILREQNENRDARKERSTLIYRQEKSETIARYFPTRKLGQISGENCEKVRFFKGRHCFDFKDHVLDFRCVGVNLYSTHITFIPSQTPDDRIETGAVRVVL